MNKIFILILMPLLLLSCGGEAETNEKDNTDTLSTEETLLDEFPYDTSNYFEWIIANNENEDGSNTSNVAIYVEIGNESDTVTLFTVGGPVNIFDEEDWDQPGLPTNAFNGIKVEGSNDVFFLKEKNSTFYDLYWAFRDKDEYKDSESMGYFEFENGYIISAFSAPNDFFYSEYGDTFGPFTYE